MNAAYLDATATAGAALITHISLVDDLGAEVGDGRKAVSWTAASGGLVRPAADLEFTMEAADVVAGWSGFSAATGGNEYGGAGLTQVTFGNPGTYTLQAASTAIDHDAA